MGSVLTVPLLVRMIRRRGGLSQQQLADELGLSRSSIANVEAGRQDLPASRILPLLEREGLLVNPINPDGTIADLAGRIETMAALLRAAEVEAETHRRSLAAICEVLAKAEAS